MTTPPPDRPPAPVVPRDLEQRAAIITMLEECAAAIRKRFEGRTSEHVALGLVAFAEGVRQRQVLRLTELSDGPAPTPGPSDSALLGEAAGLLRVELEQQMLGRQCSRCGGTWEAHRQVTLLGGMKVPCRLAEPCALLERIARGGR